MPPALPATTFAGERVSEKSDPSPVGPPRRGWDLAKLPAHRFDSGTSSLRSGQALRDSELSGLTEKAAKMARLTE